MSEDDDDKSHEPSQKRLEDARKRGEIPKSADLSTAAAYAGFVLVGLVSGGSLLQHFGQIGLVLLDQPDRLAPLLFGRAPAPVAGMAAGFVTAALPVFVVPMLAVALVLFAQRAVHFA
ncbi:MAG: EscU/YscU/HrcU family type III secretion system export apparatus switch protein, partial [Cypionkella sp.]|nr:EscU/YscU/HrcU family type III secretion system export apparatus switch protein [Cypionkella sp.]